MNDQHQPSARRLEQGQALVQVMFASTIICVFALVFVALAGTSMRQLFGDIQCKLKYGQEAYMTPFTVSLIVFD